jgi:Holliday junction resolvase-like predicted endonuclease
VSTKSRGNEAEHRAQQLLESEGYMVHRAIRTSYLGLFDLVAVHPVFPVRFIQVTSDNKGKGSGHASARRQKVLAAAEQFPMRHADLEVWRWVGGPKRLDRRYDNRKTKHYVRRQYFSVWALEPDGWQDVTPRENGWVDGYMPPASVGPGDVGPID